MTYTKTSPFLRFSPFWAFFRQKGDNCSPQAIKRGREGKETPSVHPERLQRKAVGAPPCRASGGCARVPADAGRAIRADLRARLALRALRRPRSRLARPCVVFFCAGGMGGGQQSRPSAARPAPSPPASPPFRRPLAWSRRLWCAWWGAVAPAPAGRLSVVGLVGLAAGRALSCVRATGWRVAFAPFRRARGLPPGACLADGRSVCRGVGQS